MKSGIANRITTPQLRDEVDVSSEDSFPASDPPSWTPIVRTGPPCRAGHRGGVDARDEAPVPARTVLHPTDYSETSRCAFQVACRLAPGGRVTVLHVPEPPHVPFGMARPPPLPPDYRGAWESRLGLVRSPDPTVRVDHRLEEGDPATEIVRVAGDPAHDLIVMGAGRRGGLWRALTGDVGRAVARRARCPVVRVTVPENTSYPTANRRILFATDSRERDDYSLGLAHSLALASDQQLFVLSVRAANHWTPERRGPMEQRFTNRDPRVWPLVRMGSLAEEAVRLAHDLRPSLIVLGPRHTRLGGLFHPARAVRRAAECPVLTVHLPGRFGREVGSWHWEVATGGARDGGTGSAGGRARPPRRGHGREVARAAVGPAA